MQRKKREKKGLKHLLVVVISQHHFPTFFPILCRILFLFNSHVGSVALESRGPSKQGSNM